MAVEHAAAIGVDQFLQGDARRSEFHPGRLHPAADAEGTQPLAAIQPKAAEPGRATLDDIAHPIQGLEVVFECGASEQTDFSDVGRTHTRFAALAFDALDHRRLFAADIRPGAAPQLDVRQRAGRIGPQPGNLTLQNGPAAVILVAQVEVAGGNAHHLRGNQHALEKAVRVALEISAILEGARLALVDIHRHQPGRGVAAHDAPFAPCRKTRAAQAAQARVAQGFDHLFR